MRDAATSRVLELIERLTNNVIKAQRLLLKEDKMMELAEWRLSALYLCIPNDLKFSPILPNPPKVGAARISLHPGERLRSISFAGGRVAIL